MTTSSLPAGVLAGLGLLALVGAAQAGDLVKCQDKDGKIVYVDRACETYGLRTIGGVQDRVTVMPGKDSGDDSDDDAPAKGKGKGKGGPQACRADAQKFCKGVKPGGGGIADCLVDHQKDISEDCYQFLKTRQKKNDDDKD